MRSTSALALMMASLAVGALSACGDDKDKTPDSGTDAGTNPDGGTSSGNGKCPASAYICENFDNGDNGWRQPDEKHHATIKIDDSRTRSGSGAVHVKTDPGYNEDTGQGDQQAIAHLRKDIPKFTGTKIYTRAYVYLSRSSPKDVMGTYFILFSPDEPTHEQFGGIELQGLPNGGFALDNWTGIGTGWNFQDQDPLKVKVSPNRWTCIEWGVERASPTANTGHAMAWADGELAYDFENVGMRPFTEFAVGYGFVHPKGDSESETWIDDLVVAPERIGCE